jgi:predicted nucleotidyltransferase
MRLTSEQVSAIRQCVTQLATPSARVWLFGSRVNDAARGGDVDLMIALDEPVNEPALLAAQVSTRVSRYLLGRKVDVLIQAPNLQHLPIHTLAMAEGLLL